MSQNQRPEHTPRESPAQDRLFALKEAGGFWLPNSFIDLHARALGARGVMVYCILARSVTSRFYPSVGELVRLCRTPRPILTRILALLRERGLLTDADLDGLRGLNAPGSSVPKKTKGKKKTRKKPKNTDSDADTGPQTQKEL